YELLTGQRPRYFNKNNSLSDIIQHITTTEIPAPSSVIPELPKMFDHIVAKATAMDRNQRYATVAEMLNDIRRLSKKLISGADHTYMKRWMHKELRSLRKRRAQQFEAMKKNAPQLPVSTANDKPKSSPRQSASANVSSADDTFRETPLPVAEDCHHLNIAGVLHRLKTSPLPLATSLIGAHILFLLIVFQMRQPPVSRDFAPTPPSPTPVIIQTPPRQTVACNHDMRQPAPSFAEVNIPHLQIQSEALGATLPYRPIATNSTSANNSNIKRWNAQWKKRKSQSKPR
ncbi:MAG: hypothetical protein JXX29_05455, partial [Deltaproteobacteria bacterium]|nr:hypothetical protein [Deltaproteobacteria bacterium]